MCLYVYLLSQNIKFNLLLIVVFKITQNPAKVVKCLHQLSESIKW